MKKLSALLILVVFATGCWNDVKETLVDMYSQVLTPGFSAAAGCDIPNTVVGPYLAVKFDKILKVDRGLKKEAKQFEELEKNALKAGLDSDTQKGLVNKLCKAAVKHFAPVIANRGEQLPPELTVIGCSKEKLYQSGGDFMCGFAPKHLTR